MSEVHSVHAFMFPFRWDYIVKDRDFWGNKISKENISYTQRTHLMDFDSVFSQCNTLKRSLYTINKNREKYNEYTYFHAFARKALYDLGGKVVDKQAVLYYELNGGDNDYYEIAVLNYATYRLKLMSICLHIYNTGVGVLTFNLENDCHEQPEDILHINEFGRRIYPQYMAGEAGILATKGTFLANKIKGKIGKISFEEDFSQYASAGIKPESTFLAPDFIKKIFGYKGKEQESEDRCFVFRKEHEQKGNIRISQITDDRMFVLCYYKNKILANSMNKENYLLDSFWYAFLFGDKNLKDITIKNDEMQKEHIKHHTYARWVEYYEKSSHELNSSLFGMTRDSFVCLGDWFLLPIHMKTMYYQMSVLCLVQRASVLRFEYEVSNITQLLDTSSGNINAQIKDLYKNYIEFINKIYFREVTSQIQGIEMYNQFQTVMNLEKEVKDLDGEIQELHTYVNMDEQGKLSKVATWFLPAGVVVGLMGISALEGANTKLFENGKWNFSPYPNTWIWIVIAIILSLTSGYFVSLYLKLKK